MSNGISFGRVSPNLKAKKVVILASGSSLKGFDLQRINRKDYFVITINNSVKAAPFADAWFTLDPWGIHGPQLPPRSFKGTKYVAVPQDFGRRYAKHPAHRTRMPNDIIYLQRLLGNNLMEQSSENAFALTLSEDPRCISTGNSGYGAFNLAYHLKPSKILLLGLDGTVGYFYTDAERNRPLTHLPKMFNSTKTQMAQAGIQVINGSITSKINTYPKFRLEEALEIFDAD
jgi:hypothetical protein